MVKKIEVPALTRTARLGAKAQATDDAARVIVKAEAAKRDAKTMRLRAARLKVEAARSASSTDQKPEKVAKR